MHKQASILVSATASIIAAKTGLAYSSGLWDETLPPELADWYAFALPRLPAGWGRLGRWVQNSRAASHLLYRLNAVVYPGDWEHIVMRKTLMAKRLQRHCLPQGSALVSLGAGFDGYPLVVPAHCPVLEMDQEETSLFKRRLWREYGTGPKCDFLPLELGDDVGHRIGQWVDARGVTELVIQCEGFLDYLDDRSALNLLANLIPPRLSATLLTTEFTFGRLGPFREQVSIDALAQIGEPLGRNRTSTDWERLFWGAGWQETARPGSDPDWAPFRAAYPGLDIVEYTARR